MEAEKSEAKGASSASSAARYRRVDDTMSSLTTHHDTPLRSVITRVARPGKTDWRFLHAFQWMAVLILLTNFVFCVDTTTPEGPNKFLACDIDSHFRDSSSINVGPAEISRLDNTSDNIIDAEPMHKQTLPKLTSEGERMSVTASSNETNEWSHPFDIFRTCPKGHYDQNASHRRPNPHRDGPQLESRDRKPKSIRAFLSHNLGLPDKCKVLSVVPYTLQSPFDTLVRRSRAVDLTAPAQLPSATIHFDLRPFSKVPLAFLPFTFALSDAKFIMSAQGDNVSQTEDDPNVSQSSLFPSFEEMMKAVTKGSVSTRHPTRVTLGEGDVSSTDSISPIASPRDPPETPEVQPRPTSTDTNKSPALDEMTTAGPGEEKQGEIEAGTSTPTPAPTSSHSLSNEPVQAGDTEGDVDPDDQEGDVTQVPTEDRTVPSIRDYIRVMLTQYGMVPDAELDQVVAFIDHRVHSQLIAARDAENSDAIARLIFQTYGQWNEDRRNESLRQLQTLRRQSKAELDTKLRAAYDVANAEFESRIKAYDVELKQAQAAHRQSEASYNKIEHELNRALDDYKKLEETYDATEEAKSSALALVTSLKTALSAKETELKSATKKKDVKVLPKDKTPFKHPARDLDEVWQDTGGIITRTQRADTKHFDASAVTAMTTKLHKGIKNGFQPIQLDEMATSDHSDLLNDITHLQDCLHDLKRLLAFYSMDEIFQVAKFHPESTVADPRVKRFVDLFTDFGQVTLEEVKESCHYYLRCSGSFTPTYVQDFHISREAVLASIDDSSVRIKIMELVERLPSKDRNGPVALWYLLRNICSAKQDTLIEVRRRLHTKFGFSNFKDYDVEQLTSAFMKIHQFLKTYGTNVDESRVALMRILQKCPVYEFKNFLITLDSLEHESVSTLEKLVTTAVSKFTDLQLTAKWKHRERRTYTAKKDGDKATKALLTGDKDKSKSPIRTHDRRGVPIDCTPPKKGSPTSRKNPTTGQDEDWCAPCNRWGNHSSTKHEEWKKAQAEKRKRTKKSSTDSSTTSSSSTTPTTTSTPSGSDDIPTVSRSNLAQVTGSVDPF